MIHITKPLLGEAEQRAASEAIASGWVTQGPRVAEFERAFAAYCGAKDAVAVSNCTTALHLAMIEAGVGPGDEVILPSMTFIATANVVLYCGARPVFCEVRAEDFNMDPDAIEPLITPRTKALLPVHQVGMPARMDRICAIAKAHGLVVVEDAACAAGASFQGRKIGKPFGKYVCFSFHPRKVITTGEGGMITTDDERAAQQFRLLRHHGMGVPDTARHGANKVIFESYLRVGYNYRMTDIQAAIGLEQLKRLDGIVAERRRRAAMYDEALRRLPGVQVPQAPPDVYFNFEIVMQRYETRSTMMTSNRPLEDWGKLIGDVPSATAILDRFLHHAEIITITGRSYRLKDHAAADASAKPRPGKPAPEKAAAEKEACQEQPKRGIEDHELLAGFDPPITGRF